VAKQADGAVVVRPWRDHGAGHVRGGEERHRGQDFFPLTVEYVNGVRGWRIPRGYFKRGPAGREGDPDLSADRSADSSPVPEGFKNEIQIICLAISADQENDPDICLNARRPRSAWPAFIRRASGAVGSGLVDGKLIANPTTAEQAVSSLELVIAGTEDAVLM